MKQSGPEHLIPFCLWMDPSCVKGPHSYDTLTTSRYGIFKMINKSLKSASRGKYIPVSQHDSWTNDPSTNQVSSACRSEYTATKD